MWTKHCVNCSERRRNLNDNEQEGIAPAVPFAFFAGDKVKVPDTSSVSVKPGAF